MKSELVQSLKNFFTSRQQAYWQVFNPDSVFTRTVLLDLAKFCRAYQTTFHEDPRIHAMLEGRREVFLRILHHTKLDPDQFWKLYGKGVPNE